MFSLFIYIYIYIYLFAQCVLYTVISQASSLLTPLLCAMSKPMIVNIINLYVTLWRPFHAVQPSVSPCCQLFGAV